MANKKYFMHTNSSLLHCHCEPVRTPVWQSPIFRFCGDIIPRIVHNCNKGFPLRGFPHPVGKHFAINIDAEKTLLQLWTGSKDNGKNGLLFQCHLFIILLDKLEFDGQFSLYRRFILLTKPLVGVISSLVSLY